MKEKNEKGEEKSNGTFIQGSNVAGVRDILRGVLVLRWIFSVPVVAVGRSGMKSESESGSFQEWTDPTTVDNPAL